MSWSNFTLEVINVAHNTPVSNGIVCAKFNTSGSTFITISGNTDSNGRCIINSTPQIEDETSCKLNAFDLDNLNETIRQTINFSDGETIEIDITNNYNGFLFKTRTRTTDYLFSQIGRTIFLSGFTSYVSDSTTNELYVSGYTSSNMLELSGYSNSLSIRVGSKPDEYASASHTYKLFNLFNEYIEEGGNCIKNFYHIRLPNINDTLSWNSQNKSLQNTSVNLLLYGSQNNLLASANTLTTNNISYIDFDYHGSSYASVYSIIAGKSNSSGITKIIASKHHYLNNEKNVFVSGSSLENLYFIESGNTEEIDYIVIEREPNVCMINKDLYDYANSLSPELNLDTSVTGSSYNYFYEQEKVGASYLDFYRFWCDTIGIQPTNIMSLEDFKENFVNSIASDFVRTNYALNQTIEDQFLIDSRHGYVFDRCFIPISAEPLTNYLTFYIDPQQGVNNCTISFNKIGVSGNSTFDYSTVENVWNSYTFDNNHRSIEISLTENGNNFVKFRRNLSYTSNGLSIDSNNMYYFTTSGTCFCSGSVTSLLDGFGSNSNINISQHRCFYRLFYDCDILTAPQLISTKFNAHNIYDSMFEECKLLEEPPELPCEILKDACYFNMFKGCTSLHRMPYLNSTNLETRCYLGMFEGCTSLTDITPLPSVTLSERCYLRMFKNCTSLTNSPVLSATTLVNECYEEMFYGCSSLSRITALFSTDPNGGDYTTDWVNGVNNTGVFIKGNGASWSVFGNNGVPNGWDVLFSYQEEH